MKKLAVTLLITASLVACGGKAKNTTTTPAAGSGSAMDMSGSGSGMGGGSAMAPMNGSSGGATGAADPCGG